MAFSFRRSNLRRKPLAAGVKPSTRGAVETAAGRAYARMMMGPAT
jgi:hypothetical protein